MSRDDRTRSAILAGFGVSPTLTATTAAPFSTIILTFTMAAAPAPVDAIDWCEAAAWAGWHHHGLNGACLVQIAFDWWASQGYLDYYGGY